MLHLGSFGVEECWRKKAKCQSSHNKFEIISKAGFEFWTGVVLDVAWVLFEYSCFRSQSKNMTTRLTGSSKLQLCINECVFVLHGMNQRPVQVYPACCPLIGGDRHQPHHIPACLSRDRVCYHLASTSQLCTVLSWFVT